MRILRVGIASYEEMKARTVAIAKGQLKPAEGEPRVWFTSAESFAKILSEKNRALLSVIVDNAPGSITQLAELTGRRKSNLSRTLRTMERYGFVVLKKGVRGTLTPEVPYEAISLVLPLRRGGKHRTRAA